MLVLSRRTGESLRIGARVRVQVVAVQGNRVRLAIEAPDEVSVHREEIYQRIAEANREALCGEALCSEAPCGEPRSGEASHGDAPASGGEREGEAA